MQPQTATFTAAAADACAAGLDAVGISPLYRERRIGNGLGDEWAGSCRPAPVDDAASPGFGLMQPECFPVAGAETQTGKTQRRKQLERNGPRERDQGSKALSQRAKGKRQKRCERLVWSRVARIRPIRQPLVEQKLDKKSRIGAKCLILLARPTGLEPVFPP